MEANTGLLRIERNLVACAKIFKQLPLNLLERETEYVRRVTLRTRSYLQDLEVFSPIVNAFGETTCTTCDLSDDELENNCQCRRIFITQIDDYDFSDSALEQAKNAIHYTEPLTVVFKGLGLKKTDAVTNSYEDQACETSNYQEFVSLTLHQSYRNRKSVDVVKYIFWLYGYDPPGIRTLSDIYAP